MAKIIPFGGGKGGSGKSFMAANLGVLLAKEGKRVVLVDLDLGCSNLHTLLGMKNPKTGLNGFLNKAVKSLDQVALPTDIPELYLIHSVTCSMEIANLFHAQKLKIIKAIRQLPFDYVLLDLGAGTHFNTLDFFLVSSEGFFVFTPEPTSLENAFRFIKAVYFRKMKRVLKQRDFYQTIKRLQGNDGHNRLDSAYYIVQALRREEPEKAGLLEQKLKAFTFKFVINQFRKQRDETLGRKIEKVCNRHFQSTFHFLGNITYDDRVHDSMFGKRIYVSKYPYTPTAMELQTIAKQILNHQANPLRSVS